MKRKVASRRLKRTCICCNKNFIKGNVYYIDRTVYFDNYFDELIAYESLLCAKCKYFKEKQKERFIKFKDSNVCKHPLIDEIWSLIDGEDYVQEPSHTECQVCKKRVI